MYMLLLLLFNVLIAFVRCYNLDFEYAVAKNGPSDSFFGFSVAEHYDSENKETWILVGAPKANNSELDGKYEESGTVFKCRPNDLLKDCSEQVPFEMWDVDKSKYYNKSKEWLGVSLKSGASHGVVTCAHRYEYHGLQKDYRLLEGQCYIIGERLKKPSQKYNPCNSENTVGPGTSDHTRYGQCQAGIGLDILPAEYQGEDTKFLIGAAGTKWWSGEFFQMDTDDRKSKGELPKSIQLDIEGRNKEDYRSSYFGYAVTYGNFFRKKVAHVASGGPRHKHFGKVLIYESVSNNKKNKLIQELKNEEDPIQIASGYGIALCSIDFDNNGLSELIVGAPFYLSLEGKERPEQGIVYIYSKADGEEKLVEKGTIQGEGRAYSTFGYSVANGGDLNLDEFDDLVVGAPREDGGSGAIYVYFGSKNGVIRGQYQRIAAADIHSGTTDNIGLKGFGRSLGTGVDMDDNGYNDVLVGAYLSNQVALLRSRPVVKVTSRLEFTPNQLDASGDRCDISKVSTCATVQLCFYISEPSGKLKTKNKAVLVKYTIEADPIRGTVRKNRMKFKDTESNKQSFIANSTVQYKCQELGIVSLVFNDDGYITEYPDIMFKVSYEIPYDDPAFTKPARTDSKVVSLDDYPTLQRNVGTTADDQHVIMTAQLTFKRDCTTCIPDLELSAAEQHHTLRLGKQNYEFEIMLENIGEDLAYSVSLQVRFPKTLTLNNVKIKGENVGCQKDTKKKDTNICENMISRLNKGENRTVKINLETGDFARNFNPKGENNISIIVSSANNEKVGTTSNNKLAITFDLKVDADLRLYTSAAKQVLYEGKVKGETAMRSLKDAGPIVIHEYHVTNNGPDMIELANLTIHWPYQTRTGKHLLYFVELEGVMGMKDVKCEPTKGNILNLNTDSSTGAVKAEGVITQVVDQSEPVKPNTVNNNKHRVRRATELDPLVAGTAKKVGTVLNCSTAQCMEIKCTFKNLKMRDSVKIRVKSVLWVASLLLDYGEKLSIMSSGKVVIGKNASYIRDSNIYNQEQEVFTEVIPITPQKKKEKIAVWQIALAVAAGVILLGLMIFGLYKVGFFRRTRRYDDTNGADESLIKGRN